MKKILISVGIAVALSACSTISLPISGSTSDGQSWTGYFTVQKFELSDGNNICSGVTPMGTSKIQTAEFTCEDGRTGTLTTNRTSMRGGVANVTFSDGAIGSFEYGT
ncbi:MAG: hypothetical protein P8L68_05930 [Paracoccaceae bacterium]|nr:hypothetical protein [Paracoccaceae bacterium]MDG2258015.1 hypothetical protein [Paracoccaceae bacterium]